MDSCSQQPTFLGRPGARKAAPAALFCLLVAALGWAYWPSLLEMAERWSHDPQYSHGWLVLPFALIIVWSRRRQGGSQPMEANGRGLLLLSAALGLWLVGTWFHFVWIGQVSLLPALAGAVLLCCGSHVLRFAWPAILFLIFMVPLPYRLGVAMSGPLRTVGAMAGTYLLQSFGLPALREGNVIQLKDLSLDVAEACSGLRMLMIFIALSTAMALLTNRPTWQRIIIVISAVPIALVANIVRITLTGTLLSASETAAAHLLYHDLAGWLMMPVGLILLGMECWILARLWLEAPTDNFASFSSPAENRTPWNSRAAVKRTA